MEEVKIPLADPDFKLNNENDDLSNNSEKCNSQKLSDLESDIEFFSMRN